MSLQIFTLHVCKTFLVTLPKVRELIVLCFIISVATAPSGQQLSGSQTAVQPGNVVFRGTQREYSSKPLKHRIIKRILLFKR